MKKFVLLLLISIITTFGQQGIIWQDITSQYPSLPAGVKLIKGTRTSPALNCYYFDVDLNDTTIAILPYYSTSIATVPIFCGRVGAIGAINGGFFGGTSSYSAVVTPGTVVQQNIASVTRNSKSYPVIRSFFYLTQNFTPKVDWIYHFGSTINDVYKFSQPLQYIENDPNPKPTPLSSQGTKIQELMLGVGGGPMLVKNGVKNITYNEEIMWGSGVGTTPDPRTAVGFTASRHIIMLVADGRLSQSQGFSMDELAEVFISLGCTDAVNLDGGGSSQISVGSTALNLTATRQLPTILAVVKRDSLHVPQPPRFQKTIDTGDPEAQKVGTGWFASSNPGYWGTTQCQLCAIGDGSQYYKFSANLPKRAVYKVQAWYVDANNRSTDTPFIIKHDGNVDTVRVNQTTNGLKWFDVGTYTFNGDSSEYIMIANATTHNQYVAADAVRLISNDTAFVTSISNPKVITNNFELLQNYPNPFNPSTTISYTIQKASNVKLSVYNLLGEEVASLVNQYQQSGSYKVYFDAQKLSAGVYFYRLNTPDYVKTNKMIFLK